MLAVIHKIVLGLAPLPFETLITRSKSTLLHHGFKCSETLHNKQLHDCTGRSSPVMLKRSLFGLVHVYNRLPQNIVDCTSVKVFQSRLQCIVKTAIESNPKWDLVLHRNE